MRKPVKPSIPLHTMSDRFGSGVAIGKATVGDQEIYEEAGHLHRDDYHLFSLLEKGTATIEIDFQKHKIYPFTVTYIHPHQVHGMKGFKNVTASIWAINSESLNPEYKKLLDDIAPAKPLRLDDDAFSILSESVSLCLRLSERNHEKSYNSLLRDGCNILVGLVISQYLAQTKPTDTLSRYEVVTKAFKELLKQNYVTAKMPSFYAQKLNISTNYLNECVKNTTGSPVSHHIQQHIILEAKRLLFHSDQSVKEIAAGLGYEDAAYFSRMFSKITGITALTFRNKNHD